MTSAVFYQVTLRNIPEDDYLHTLKSHRGECKLVHHHDENNEVLAPYLLEFLVGSSSSTQPPAPESWNATQNRSVTRAVNYHRITAKTSSSKALLLIRKSVLILHTNDSIH